MDEQDVRTGPATPDELAEEAEAGTAVNQAGVAGVTVREGDEPAPSTAGAEIDHDYTRRRAFGGRDRVGPEGTATEVTLDAGQ